MNKRTDASKHATKGLCTSKIERIHKINDFKKKIGNGSHCTKKSSLDGIHFDMLKKHLLSFEDSFVSLMPNSPRNRMCD